jgi:hypothetical protein
VNVAVADLKEDIAVFDATEGRFQFSALRVRPGAIDFIFGPEARGKQCAGDAEEETRFHSGDRPGGCSGNGLNEEVIRKFHLFLAALGLARGKWCKRYLPGL